MATRILVVDDSRTARQQVSDALAETGFQIIEAIDGNEGLSKILDGGPLSLVICDVNMPNMNGLEMLRALRKAAADVAPPVIMLTTEAQPELLQQAKEAGAKGWIVKPFKRALLVAAVRKLVGARAA